MLRRLLVLALAIFMLALPLSAGRLYFYLKYMEAISGSGALATLNAFLVGLRFDLALIGTLGWPLLIALYIPGVIERRTLYRAITAAALALYLVILCYNFIDIQYYAFAMRHITFELENAWQDTDVLLKIGLREYLLSASIYILLLMAYAVAFSRMMLWARDRAAEVELGYYMVGFSRKAVLLVFVAALCVVMGRGGVQSKPLGVSNAFDQGRVELGVLSLNGVYTTYKTLMQSISGEGSLGYLTEMTRPVQYSAQQRDIEALIVDREREIQAEGFPLLRTIINSPGQLSGMNVVIFVMESWSAKFMGAYGAERSLTPFFDSIASDGVLVENCFANAQRSVEGLPAILGSVPSVRGMVFGVDAVTLQTRTRPFAMALSDAGYHTVFVHGAPRGSMRFDGLVSSLGFNRHIAMEELESGPDSLDGVWGVYDHLVFEKTAEGLDLLDRPFLMVVYSLSSHSPYSVPSEGYEYYKDVPNARFFNSLRYSDIALRGFFDSARSGEAFDNTLFVIVADHTEGKSTITNLHDLYSIPCLFYAPGRLSPARLAIEASQLDIAPSIMDLLGVKQPFTSWGKSVFASPASPRAEVLPLGEMFVYVRDGQMMLAQQSGPISLIDYVSAPEENLLQTDWAANEALAWDMYSELVQYLHFTYGLISSNMVAPERLGAGLTNTPTDVQN